ncbi:hypothetical protein IFR05_006091 [Cadophora sp. M221]|nr:hypothetical protein IFR05_006091 [Cadophora sp. M221]
MAEIPTVEILTALKLTQKVLDAVDHELKALRAILIHKPKDYHIDVVLLDLKERSANLLQLATQERSTSSTTGSSANSCA